MEIEFAEKESLWENKKYPLHLLQNQLYNNIFEILVDGKSLFFNFSTYFATQKLLWMHDQLDLGVMVSKGVWHKVPVFISLQSDKPIYL